MSDYRENLARIVGVGWGSATLTIVTYGLQFAPCNFYALIADPEAGKPGTTGDGVWVGQTSGTVYDARGIEYGVVTLDTSGCTLSGAGVLADGARGAIAVANERISIWNIGNFAAGFVAGETVKIYATPEAVPA